MRDESYPSYALVFAVLVAALLVSLGITAVMQGAVAVTLVFAVALLKAYLVLNYFVHLRDEPRWIKVLVFGVLCVLAILYLGLIPDVVWVYGGSS